MTELFPKSDQMGETIMIEGTEIVAFDLDGERYCVECAQEMDSIDIERFHKDPYSVPYGGSVQRRHLYETNHEWNCGNSNCGKKIPQ